MIYYIGNYARQANEWKLFQAPAAANKMKYILYVIKDISPCTLVSLAAFKEHSWKFYRTKKIKLDERECDVIMPSIGSPIRIFRAINSLLVPVFTFLYLLFNVKKDDTVVLYHSMAYTKVIALCKRIKKFRMIMEIEEIYADVACNLKGRQKELKLFKAADGYIFPTHMLSEAVNIEKKPEIIIHGTYQVEPNRKCRNDVWNLHIASPNDIHCVYAGTLDPRKGGAIAAAAAAEFLPNNYHMHILGFGSEKEMNNIKELTSNLAKRCKCTITFDGLLSGDDYIKFIQSCDIGLSTQNPHEAFNATSFPSKILSYMSNGLRVVSIRIPAVEKSDIGKYLYYYDEQTPENIAKAILSIKFTDEYDSRSLISKLSKRFTEELADMLG